MEDKEKNEVQDAEVSEVENDADTGVDSSKKTKSRGYHTEIILIFIIGLLLGIMAKAESLKTLSIGFSDYRLKGGAQEYDMDAIEKKLIEDAEKNQQEMQKQQEEQTPQGSEGGEGAVQQ